MEVVAMKACYAAAAALGFLAIAVPTGLDSCAIAPPEPVFATRQGPADLQGEFLKGRIGVLQRSYKEIYLIGAFRALSGAPLTEQEADSLYPDAPQGGIGQSPGSAAESWLAARQHVQGLPAMPRVEVYKTVNLPGLQYSFANCQANAFEKAVETLSSLAADWGFDNPQTLEWATAQDQVFANCSATQPTIPAPPHDGMDPVLAAHRRYQIAAAWFYAGDLRKAAQSFQEIAAEKDSPWREIAPYLAARALLRAGLLNGDREAFRQGKERIRTILDDPQQSGWHEASTKLLDVWRLRAEPEVRLKELGSALAKPSDEEILQPVVDFLYLVDAHPELAETEDADEMAAWVVTMSGRSVHSAEVATRWWRKRRNDTWLIPALANAKAEDSEELVQAAAKIPPASPAYESVAYYATRLAKRAGRPEEARRFADRALRHNLLHSSRNWILAERLDLARAWSEFLRFSLRHPEPKVQEYEGKEVEGQEAPLATGAAPVFDSDARHVFDSHLPLALWVDASRNKALPPHMQERIALSGWVRAVLLGRNEEARSLMQRVVELQPGAAEVAKGFLEARDPGEARFASAYLSLWAPSVCPYLLDAEDRTPNLASPRAIFADTYGHRQSCWYLQRSANPGQPHPEDTGFLTAEQRAAGEKEARQIESAPPWQATYLLKESIEWARAHPDDPRVPQALHMAVAASRYRHTDADTGKYSEQAFDLLHRRYPKSEWAARTPYWFK
jgi:tetratricopeptide (TPR) repeat protein